MFLLIDNYDSFTYNIVHYLADLNIKVTVKRNDEISVSEIDALAPKAIFISPGPCTPNEAGICLDLIKEFHNKYPILGICLGHQAIAQSFGAKIIKSAEPVHGKISEITHNNSGIFTNLPSPFKATRYHSLIIDKNSLPEDFIITSETQELPTQIGGVTEGKTLDKPGAVNQVTKNIIMGIKHQKFPLEGVQFHPESIGTDHGKTIFKNFLDLYC